MRIAFVSTEIAPLRGGGIGTYVAEAGRALAARGHEVWLLTKPLGDATRPEGFARVIEVVPRADGPRFLFGGERFAHAHAVHEALAGCGASFDYVEIADYGAEGLVAVREQNLFRSYGDAALALMLHTPSYECYQWNGQMHVAGAAEQETFLLEDEVLRDAPFVHAPSAAVRDLVCARLGRDPRGVELVRYPMALPAQVVVMKPARALRDLEFVFFGRIEPRKGIANLIEAFRAMPDLRLRLIGADTPFSPYGQSLAAWLARRLPANVTIEGAKPRAELLHDLARPEVVCVLPSLFENWPNACIEAMGLGRVVVGSRHGGMAEMIEHGVSGFLADGREPSDLVRVIRDELGARLSQLDAIGTAAAARIRRLADPGIYAARIEELVAAHRASARRAAPSVRSSKVTIVIPFYKDKDTIDEAVGSAIAQDHADIEVLLVDDGSPLPDADAILARCAGRDARVRVVRKANGGLPSARNFGIAQATGDYVLMLDADNALRPEYARLAAAALDAHPDRGFAVPYARFFDGGTGQDVGTYNPMPYAPGFALLINRFGDAGACFRRSTLVEKGLAYDELLISFEDWALWMDCDRAGVRGLAIPRVLYDYRMRGDSMMQVDAWPNFRALVGLLIERHLPADDGMRAMLWTLNQTWGRDAKEMERVREERGRWPFRYWFVDKLHGLVKRVPGVGRMFDRIGARLMGR